MVTRPPYAGIVADPLDRVRGPGVGELVDVETP
jgi:hypothetical protein